MIIDVIGYGILDCNDDLAKFLVDHNKAYYFDEKTCKRIGELLKEELGVKDDAPGPPQADLSLSDKEPHENPHKPIQTPRKGN